MAISPWQIFTNLKYVLNFLGYSNDQRPDLNKKLLETDSQK